MNIRKTAFELDKILEDLIKVESKKDTNLSKMRTAEACNIRQMIFGLLSFRGVTDKEKEEDVEVIDIVTKRVGRLLTEPSFAGKHNIYLLPSNEK